MSKKELVAADALIQIDKKPVILRTLVPHDLAEVKALCEDWFPVQYPSSWYEDITCSSRFYSLAAVYNEQIIGLIVAEMRVRANCNREEHNILDPTFPTSTRVVYILSLGVVKAFRCHGIASLLLEELLAHAHEASQQDCKAVYLHVLSTNHTAIKFYERRKFQQQDFLPYYYCIEGVPRDGYCYVRYVNGGYPPWSVFDYLKHMSQNLGKLQPCAIPRRMWQGLGNWMRRLIPHLSNQCQSCIPTFTNLETT